MLSEACATTAPVFVFVPGALDGAPQRFVDGLIAEGRADIYPRLSPTSEWDTAAGHAVLLAAGGRVDGPDGAPLAYGKTAFLNIGFCATAGWKAPRIAPFLPVFTA